MKFNLSRRVWRYEGNYNRVARVATKSDLFTPTYLVKLLRGQVYIEQKIDK
jgi:hypothetical protein